MGAVKQVVYISWMPLSEKVERDWYISHLESKCVTVQYWDIGKLFFKPGEFGTSIDRSYVTSVADVAELKALVHKQDLRETNFVLLFNYEPRFHPLFRILSKHGCKLYFFEWGNFPIKQRGAVGRYAKMLSHPSRIFTKAADRIRNLLAFKLKLVKPFDVVFAGGAASFAMHPKAAKKVPVNLCDFDNYKLSLAGERLVPGRYCVFLDINLAFQSDLKLVGWEYVTPAQYVASLERFFEMVEERYQVEVVIAAHPKAQYGDLYFGRKALKGLTPELVRDAEFVISHHSTAISYAVLNKKPLLFIYTSEMARIYRETIVGWLGDFSEYLHQPLYNVDEVNRAEEIELVQPDPERYDLYKYNYLTTPESEHRLTRDIFFDAVTA